MSYEKRILKARKRDAKRERVVDLVTRASIEASLLKKQLDLEHKHVEFNFPGTTLGTGGSVFYLTAIAEGDGINQRIGRKVNMLSSYLTGTVKLSNSTPTDSAVCRIMVVRDKASNGVAPLFSDVLQYSAFVDSPYNIDKVGPRFDIVSNLVYGMSYMDTTFVVDDHKRLDDGSVSYSGTTNLQSDAATGHIYLMAMVSYFPLTTQSVTFNGEWRGMYMDA